MEVEAGIGFANAGVRHVLETVADSPTRSHIPIEADMAGELGICSEIAGSKMITADVGRTEAAFKRDRKPGAAQFEARTKGANESVITMLAQPTRGEINPRLQVPIGGQAPAPKIVVEECFGLSEMLAGVFGWKTDASTDRLKLEFLLLRLGGKRQCATEQG